MPNVNRLQICVLPRSSLSREGVVREMGSETPACPLCRQSIAASTPFIPGRVRCPCGMVFQPEPDPALLNKFWEHHDYNDPALYGPRRAPSFRNLVRSVESLLPRGRWLDIGCGSGYLLAEVVKNGWQGFGIDLSLTAVEIAKGEGLQVVCGRFPHDAPTGPFDVISMIYALEYFEDSRSMLAECRARLMPGGLLALQLKNISFWQYAERWCRTKNGIWCPPDIRSYSVKTIVKLLHLAGFERVITTPAELPGRRLSNAAFRLLAIAGLPLLSPSMIAIARVPDDQGRSEKQP